MSAWDVIAGQFFKQKTPGNKQRPSDRRLEDFLGKSSKLRANAITAGSVFDSSIKKALLRKGSFFCAKGSVAKLDSVAGTKALGPIIAPYAKYVLGEKGLCAKKISQGFIGKSGSVLGFNLCGQACFALPYWAVFSRSLSLAYLLPRRRVCEFPLGRYYRYLCRGSFAGPCVTEMRSCLFSRSRSIHGLA